MQIKRGDIVIVKVPYKNEHVGSIQIGRRPYLIIQNDIGNQYSSTTIGIPITSKEKCVLPTHVKLTNRELDNGQLLSPSIVMAEQITTFDKTHIIKYCGHVHNYIMDNIVKKSICTSLSV